MPSPDAIQQLLSGREKRYFQQAFSNGGEERYGYDETNSETIEPHSTLDEFARLFVLIRDDDMEKEAASPAMYNELNRVELEYKVTRNSYWKIAEQRFTDSNVRSVIDLASRVDEVNSDAHLGLPQNFVGILWKAEKLYKIRNTCGRFEDKTTLQSLSMFARFRHWKCQNGFSESLHSFYGLQIGNPICA